MAVIAIGDVVCDTISTDLVSVTTVGFQPAAVLLHAAYAGTSSDGYTGSGYSIGFFTSSDNGYSIGFQESGWDTYCGGCNNSDTYCLTSYYNTLVFGLTVDTVDTDGFKLAKTAVPASGFRIRYVAFGGSTTAKAGTFYMEGASGDQSITGVGFTPSFLLNIHTSCGLNSYQWLGYDASFGWATGADAQCMAMAVGEESGGTSSTYPTGTGSDSTFIIGNLSASGAANHDVNATAELKSMDADGFTVTWRDTDLSSDSPFFYLALGGVDAKAGTTQTWTDTSVHYDTTANFQPTLVLWASTHRDASGDTTSTDHSHFGFGTSIGGGTAGNNGSIAGGHSLTGGTFYQAYTSGTYLFTHGQRWDEALIGYGTCDSFEVDGYSAYWADADDGAYWAHACAIKIYTAAQANTGAQTNTGGLNKDTTLVATSRTLGSQTNTGNAAKLMLLQRTVFGGAISFAGVIIRAVRKLVAGVMNFVGAGYPDPDIYLKWKIHLWHPLADSAIVEGSPDEKVQLSTSVSGRVLDRPDTG